MGGSKSSRPRFSRGAAALLLAAPACVSSGGDPTPDPASVGARPLLTTNYEQNGGSDYLGFEIFDGRRIVALYNQMSGSPTRSAWVIPTDEELMIARHTLDLAAR